MKIPTVTLTAVGEYELSITLRTQEWLDVEDARRLGNEILDELNPWIGLEVTVNARAEIESTIQTVLRWHVNVGDLYRDVNGLWRFKL